MKCPSLDTIHNHCFLGQRYKINVIDNNTQTMLVTCDYILWWLNKYAINESVCR